MTNVKCLYESCKYNSNMECMKKLIIIEKMYSKGNYIPTCLHNEKRTT